MSARKATFLCMAPPTCKTRKGIEIIFSNPGQSIRNPSTSAFPENTYLCRQKKGFGGTDPQELKGARRSYRFTQKLKANAFDGTANQLSAYNSVQLLYNSLPHLKDNLSS